MGAPKGNQFWKARSSHGRKPIFETPEIMWDACAEYFEWVEDNPLQEAVVYQGEIGAEPKPLMRAMTVKGLCIFLDVGEDYFNDFEQRLDKDTDKGKDFARVIKKVRNIIDTQKFEGASAGLLNPNIIARDLGLSEKTDNKHDATGSLASFLSTLDGKDSGLPDGDN